MLGEQSTRHVGVTWWSHLSVVLTQLKNGFRGLTWVWVIWADRAEQVLLPLVVELAQQLAFLQHKLITLPQLPVAHTAAEAVQVVHTLQGTHHKLCGCDLLHAAAALGRKQPAEKQSKSWKSSKWITGGVTLTFGNHMAKHFNWQQSHQTDTHLLFTSCAMVEHEHSQYTTVMSPHSCLNNAPHVSFYSVSSLSWTWTSD